MEFSIIIPTMWKSKQLIQMLRLYDKCARIIEIILIDNNIKEKKKLPKLKKLVYLPQEENIFVNPAWNLGASLAKGTIILANDDITIKDIEGLLDIYENSEYDLIGCKISEEETEKSIYPIKRFPANCFGGLMCVKKYLYIPENLKIWAGDRLLFDNLSTGIVSGYVFGEISTTVNSIDCKKQCRADSLAYNKMIKNRPFNIIVRTSNRPNYFKTCIESIDKFAPHSKVHVIYDDIKDLDYIKRYAPKATVYEVNRDNIQRICGKIPIERKPFIYNEYLNVVMPFIRGWCMILDDDDELVTRVNIVNNRNNFYIHKVNVGNGIIVPRKKGEPKFRDISMIGLVFYAKNAVRFTPQRGGDYQFALEMYNSHNTVFVDKILSKSQTGGNMGNRKDKLK